MEEKKPHGLGEQLASHSYVPPDKLPVPTEGVSEAEKTRTEFEELKKMLLKKFPFALSLGIVPSAANKLLEEDEGFTPEESARKLTHLYFIIPEEHYKDIAKKIKPEVLRLVKELKLNVWVHLKTPVDVWNYGLDSKFDLIDTVAASYPLYDKGFLGALRVANIHKALVVRKFEKYVATYAVGGSLVRGTAGKDSDVDTFVVIDDTDVKKMPRVQLLERLRGYIHEYIKEASALAGVKNILNVQVYLLTDFWQSVKDATPVIFTFIRDGVPMYDRGTFLPWKLLLKMGKIKPSPEAVDTFMKYGDQNESLVKRRLVDAMIDIYWGVVTPTQALMMLAGHAPPVPKTMVQEVKQAFMVNEKIMGAKELKTLEKVVKLYKDYEHGKLQSVSGEEIDVLLKESAQYDKRLKELRKKLEARLLEHTAESSYKEVFGLLEQIVGSGSAPVLMKKFNQQLIKEGKIKPRFAHVLKEVSRLNDRNFVKKLSQNAIEGLRRDAVELVNALVEYSQRKELVLLERGVLQITFGTERAELVVTDNGTYVVQLGNIRKVESGSLKRVEPEELESSIKETKNKAKLSLSADVLAILKKELGPFELLL